MDVRRSTVAMAAVLAVLALGALGAALLGPKLLNLPAPLASSRPWAPPAEAPSRRVLVIVLDGLRADTAKSLPGLQALARKGTSLDLWADPPTFSASQYVALLTGVPPADSGVRTNAGLRPVGLDNLAARVRKSVHLGDDVDWWEQLFGHAWSHAEVNRDAFLARASALLPTADFALLHLCGVDSAGHNFGASSAEYQRAAIEADRVVTALAAQWPGPVVVVADHGHVDAGGHGGDEVEVRKTWMVLAGSGVKPGVTLPDAKTIDVAPTVAALLGVPAPASAEGRTLTAALDFDTAAIAGADQARLAQVDAVLAAARTRLVWTDRAWGVLRLLGVAACAVLLVGARRRFPLASRRGLWAGLACLFGTLLISLALWGPRSLGDSHWMGWTVARAAVISTVLSILALGIARRSARRLGEGVAVAFSFAAGAGALAAGCFIAVGAFTPRLVCQPSWLAALPMVAYAAFAPPALLALCTAIPSVFRAFGVESETEPFLAAEGALD